MTDLISLLTARFHASLRTALGVCLAGFLSLGVCTQNAYAEAHAVQDSGGLPASLRIGYRTDAAPFAYKDESGQPAGYTVALCGRIAEELQAAKGSLEIEYVPLTAAERGPAIRNGRVDMLCGADTVTLSRRKIVSFSVPVFVGGIGALVSDAAPRQLRDLLEDRKPPFRPRAKTSFADILRQRTFTVVDGSLAEDWLAAEIDKFQIVSDTITAPDYATGIEQVLSGEADVFFGDRAILLYAAKNSRESDELNVLDRRFTTELIAIALQRDNSELRLFVDTVLSRLYRSGELEEIYRRSFGAPDEETLSLFRQSALPE